MLPKSILNFASDPVLAAPAMTYTRITRSAGCVA